MHQNINKGYDTARSTLFVAAHPQSQQMKQRPIKSQHMRKRNVFDAQTKHLRGIKNLQQ